MKRTMLIVVAMLVLATVAFAQSAPANLAITATVSSGISLNFDSTNAALDSASGLAAAKAITLSGPSNLNTNFNVNLIGELFNSASTSADLQAALTDGSTGLTFKVGGASGTTLTTTPATVSTVSSMVQGTPKSFTVNVYVSAPTTLAASSSYADTIAFTLVAK